MPCPVSLAAQAGRKAETFDLKSHKDIKFIISHIAGGFLTCLCHLIYHIAAPGTVMVRGRDRLHQVGDITQTGNLSIRLDV